MLIKVNNQILNIQCITITILKIIHENSNTWTQSKGLNYLNGLGRTRDNFEFNLQYTSASWGTNSLHCSYHVAKWNCVLHELPCPSCKLQQPLPAHKPSPAPGTCNCWLHASLPLPLCHPAPWMMIGLRGDVTEVTYSWFAQFQPWMRTLARPWSVERPCTAHLKPGHNGKVKNEAGYGVWPHHLTKRSRVAFGQRRQDRFSRRIYPNTWPYPV